MSKEDLALPAFALSVVVAAWNLLKFKYDGARVRVTLKPGTFDGQALAAMNTYSSNRGPDAIDNRGLRFNIEVALVEIENYGRTAVTLRNVGLDLGRTRWWRFGCQTITLPYINFDGCEVSNKARLEPYDNVQYLVNASHALRLARERGRGKTINIRATAQVVGRRATRSSWRRRWRLARSAPPRLWPGDGFDLAREIYRLLYSRLPATDSKIALMLPELSMVIAEWIEAGNKATREAIGSIIDDRLKRWSIDEPIVTTFWAHELATEFDRVEACLLDGSSFKRRRLAREAAIRARGEDRSLAAG
ncbi:hypothetical protein ACFQS1_39180 [Paractinoplanes rhizophilus]|uniref:Uncharacterized protein n=1 Tax=Paractinoplanes rhizophilus TaxID=1416877 RepID=A0ABW2I561_9ACTN